MLNSSSLPRPHSKTFVLGRRGLVFEKIGTLFWCLSFPPYFAKNNSCRTVSRTFTLPTFMHYDVPKNNDISNSIRINSRRSPPTYGVCLGSACSQLGVIKVDYYSQALSESVNDGSTLNCDDIGRNKTKHLRKKTVAALLVV